MANAKYQFGKIYTIRSNITPLVYVGSTCQRHLSSRMTGHRSKFKAYKNGRYHYCAAFDIFEVDENCYIELYEYYPCNTDLELRKREGEIIRQLDCCNKHIAGRTKNEYYQEEKEKYAKRSQKHNCECGGKYITRNKARHMKSKKHREYMDFMYN